MSFGIEMRNQNGSEIFTGEETAMQYWGKLIVNKTGAGITEVTCFNIPTSFKISVYSIRGNTYEGTSFYPILFEEGGLWKIRVTGNVGVTSTNEVYVFVEPAALPDVDYGIEFFDANGKSQYKAIHPLLKIEGIAEAWVDPSPMVTNHSPLISSSSKLAIQCTHIWNKSMPPNGQIGFLYSCSSTKTPTGCSHGITETTTSGANTILSYGTFQIYNYGYIDAAYYDQFSNLPNWS